MSSGEYLSMKVMRIAETGIRVVTTKAYETPWDCLEGHSRIVFHKKFDTRLFPDGIPARAGCMATRYELLRDLAKLHPEDPRAEIWTKV